jgi:hypothetical protein
MLIYGAFNAIFPNCSVIFTPGFVFGMVLDPAAQMNTDRVPQ